MEIGQARPGQAKPSQFDLLYKSVFLLLQNCNRNNKNQIKIYCFETKFAGVASWAKDKRPSNTGAPNSYPVHESYIPVYQINLALQIFSISN